jgi:hypothetical protein
MDDDPTQHRPVTARASVLVVWMAASISSLTAGFGLVGLVAFGRWWADPLGGAADRAADARLLADAGAAGLAPAALVAWLVASALLAVSPARRRVSGLWRWWPVAMVVAASVVGASHLLGPTGNGVIDPAAVRLAYVLGSGGHLSAAGILVCTLVRLGRVDRSTIVDLVPAAPRFAEPIEPLALPSPTPAAQA